MAILGTMLALGRCCYASEVVVKKDNDMKSIASRLTYITEEQAETFLSEMEKYKNMGENAWSITDPCSDFAARIWETVTGEDL